MFLSCEGKRNFSRFWKYKGKRKEWKKASGCESKQHRVNGWLAEDCDFQLKMRVLIGAVYFDGYRECVS